MGGKVALRYLKNAAEAAAWGGDGDGGFPQSYFVLDSVPAALAADDDPHGRQVQIDPRLTQADPRLIPG